MTVGDSYVSGEGARWAGNTTRRAGPVDALGPSAYDTLPGQKSQPGCHRARQSVATLRLPGYRGRNLACSGATSRSRGGGNDDGRFTPGLDFYRNRGGDRGQAATLRRFARGHDVSHVVVSIGGNDFGFGPVVSSCALRFIGLGRERRPCSDDPDVTSRFGPARARTVTGEIRAALLRLVAAMRQAGYDEREWTLTVLTYPSPLPGVAQVRYADERARYGLGGCPFYDSDLDWANTGALATINRAVEQAATSLTRTEVLRVDLSRALTGHRLCERGVETFPASGLGSWQGRGAAARLEWVNRLYFTFTPWRTQESLHPNYWGMRAQRSCLALALEHGVRGRVACRPRAALTADGAPAMRLTR